MAHWSLLALPSSILDALGILKATRGRAFRRSLSGQNFVLVGIFFVSMKSSVCLRGDGGLARLFGSTEE